MADDTIILVVQEDDDIVNLVPAEVADVTLVTVADTDSIVVNILEGPQDNVLFRTMNFVIDGGGLLIQPGVKGIVLIDFNCVIESATLVADQTGSAVVDVWKDTYNNSLPTIADSITGSAKPTIVSGIKSQDNVLTGWIKNIASGSVLLINVDSAVLVQRLTLALKLKMT